MTWSSARNGDSSGGRDREDAAREALADVVVRVALELERHARRRERAEALARGARGLDADGVLGQALRAVAPRDLAAEHRAEGAVARCGCAVSMTTGVAASRGRASTRSMSVRSSTRVEL